MKRSKFYLMMLGLATGATFSACSSDEPGLNQTPDGDVANVRLDVKASFSSTGAPIDAYNTTQSRGANVNGNQWYQDWDRPTNVTQEEIDKVLAAVAEPRVGAKNDIHIDWNNYWVQQVYTGEQTYVDGYGKDIGTGSSHMNHLLAYSSKKSQYSHWDQELGQNVYELVDKGEWDDKYEHINNFNNGANNTVYTDGETGEQFFGTTLMTDMYAEGIVDQFGYHNSTDSKNHYEYIIIEVDGEYYICFDFYATHPEGQDANKNMDVERDWIFNDWIVKISPAYHVGETPEKPENPGTPDTPDVPGETCPDCGHAVHDGVCSDCEFGDGCYDNGGNPGTPGTGDEPQPPVFVPKNEVEVNLHGTDHNGELESHLSIHVRAATDVEVFIPVPKEFYCEADDMAIVQWHEENHMTHGGPFQTTYVLQDKEDGPFTVTLNVQFEDDGIRVWTDGITQEVIDFCYKHHEDGLTFEVWNYFENVEGFNLDVLKEYLNQATVKFLDECPDAYINAFADENDCDVSIVEEQRGNYNDPYEGEHFNGSDQNQIYINKESEE